MRAGCDIGVMDSLIAAPAWSHDEHILTNDDHFNVINKMDEETSVHWHGLILPNFYNIVPYLTTPPIKPGTTFQYIIPINQSGTYWDHSHTMLQEQKGVYGSIVIRPKEKTLEYVDNLTVLSKSASDNIKETLAQMGKKDEYITYIQKAVTRKDSINLALGFKLKSVLKDGLHDDDIQINVEKTVVYISIADKLLFTSGSSQASERAKEILGKVANVISSREGMEVQVEGYTDDVPINRKDIKLMNLPEFTH